MRAAGKTLAAGETRRLGVAPLLGRRVRGTKRARGAEGRGAGAELREREGRPPASSVRLDVVVGPGFSRFSRVAPPLPSCPWRWATPSPIAPAPLPQVPPRGAGSRVSPALPAPGCRPLPDGGNQTRHFFLWEPLTREKAVTQSGGALEVGPAAWAAAPGSPLPLRGAEPRAPPREGSGMRPGALPLRPVQSAAARLKIRDLMDNLKVTHIFVI